MAADADRVWRQVTRFEGINGELRPLLRMTVPGGWEGRTLDEVEPPQRLNRSWLLLFGFVPVDYDDITIAELGPGHRFLERSEMMSASRWEHERTVVSTAADSCLVTDRVRFTARWRPLRPVLRIVVPHIFAHRHRRLRRMYAPR